MRVVRMLDDPHFPFVPEIPVLVFVLVGRECGAAGAFGFLQLVEALSVRVPSLVFWLPAAGAEEVLGQGEGGGEDRVQAGPAVPGFTAEDGEGSESPVPGGAER